MIPALAEHTTFRVLSYNIAEGGEGRLPEIVAVIRAHQPDAVALVEANSRANVEQLARDLEMDAVFAEANSGYHIAWLSRLPIRRWRNDRLLSLAKTLLGIELHWHDAPLHLFATHLGSRWDVPQPITEIPVILETLRPLADQPLALVGDFNALAPDDPVGTLPAGVVKRGEAVDGVPRPVIPLLHAAGYEDCYRRLHPREPGFTYPADAPWLRLDYILASPPLAACLIACAVDDSEKARRASDHLPIWAEFQSSR